MKEWRPEFGEDVKAEGGAGDAEVMAVNKELNTLTNKTPPRTKRSELACARTVWKR